jgi:hypothetical protein
MNSLVKIEIWDDDLMKDERVGTYYLNFKEIKDKSIGPKWINFYGPPLLPDEASNEYA